MINLYVMRILLDTSTKSKMATQLIMTPRTSIPSSRSSGTWHMLMSLCFHLLLLLLGSGSTVVGTTDPDADGAAHTEMSDL